MSPEIERMAEISPISNPGNYKLALQRIKKLFNEGNTVVTADARLRMGQRRLTDIDLAHCIRYGRIIEHSKPMTYWRYTMLGQSVEKRRMKCVVEINGNLMIVTVI